MNRKRRSSKCRQSGTKVVKPVFKTGQTGFVPEFRGNAYVMRNVTKGQKKGGLGAKPGLKTGLEEESIKHPGEWKEHQQHSFLKDY